MRLFKTIRPCVVGLVFLNMLTASCSLPVFQSDDSIASQEVGSRQLAVTAQTETQAAESQIAESAASQTAVGTQAEVNIKVEKEAVSDTVVTNTKQLETAAQAKTVADVNTAKQGETAVIQSPSNKAPVIVVSDNPLATKSVKKAEDEEPEKLKGDGSVLRVVGRATVTTADGEIHQIAKGSTVNSSDMISTSSRSYVRMKMKDASYVMIRPDSRLSIDDFKYDKNKPKEDKGFYSLLKGGFRSVTGLMKDKKKYRYRTAVATIGIRGTEFSVRVCNFDCYDVDPIPENGFYLEVHDKKVIVSTKAGDFPFTKGQFVYVANSDSPAVLVTDIPDIFDQAAIPSPTQDCDQ